MKKCKQLALGLCCSTAVLLAFLQLMTLAKWTWPHAFQPPDGVIINGQVYKATPATTVMAKISSHLFEQLSDGIILKNAKYLNKTITRT